MGGEDDDKKSVKSNLSHEGAIDTCREVFGCCADGGSCSFVDFFDLILRVILALANFEPGRKQIWVDRGGVIRMFIALCFNITVLYIALFETSPHFLLVLFFAVLCSTYTVFIVLLAVKFWEIGFRAKYYQVYTGIYKIVELLMAVTTLVLLSVGEDGPFSNGGDIFIAVVSILDIVVDFVQTILLFYKYCYKGDGDRVKPFHGEENTTFCCIQAV